MALVAPEFIRLVLGVKWLPMLSPFRLMLVYTLLDPIKMTVANLFTAVGQPERVVTARSVQLTVLAGGLFILGPPFGITGVALAVDIMLGAGIGLLLWFSRIHVDFSLKRLFSAPALALLLAILLAAGIDALPVIGASPWLTGSVKAIVFSVVYGVMLMAFEFRETVRMVSSVLARFGLEQKTSTDTRDGRVGNGY
jgi:O-antigen/teichoic acid export membrane protein